MLREIYCNNWLHLSVFSRYGSLGTRISGLGSRITNCASSQLSCNKVTYWEDKSLPRFSPAHTHTPRSKGYLTTPLQPPRTATCLELRAHLFLQPAAANHGLKKKLSKLASLQLSVGVWCVVCGVWCVSPQSAVVLVRNRQRSHSRIHDSCNCILRSVVECTNVTIFN